MNIRDDKEDLEDKMKTRIISAIALALIFIPLLILGKLPFQLLVLVIAIASQHELLKVRRVKKEFPIGMELASYIIVGLLTIINASTSNLTFELDYRVIIAMILVFLSSMVFYNNNKKYNLNDALFLMASSLFIGISMNIIILLRNFNLLYILYILIITTVTDTFALITGKFIGANLLAKDISPKKTVEGLIGGTVWGTLTGIVFYMTVIDPGLNLLILAFMTLSISLIAQLGDLVFSAIKRYYDKKDFSNLIPGHGGILDRIDSLIFAGLAFVLFLAIL